jgi:hypothetical protein
MLDSGDKAGCLSCEIREGRFQYRCFEVHLPRDIDDPLVPLYRSMAEMDQHVCECEGVEGKVAGAVTWIATDNDIETLVPEGTCPIGRTTLEAGRELESHPFRPPVPQLPD